MSETKDIEKYFFEIDLDDVNLDSYDDFGKYGEIHIFMLTTTLPNPYTLVMFGVLKLFLEMIKKQYPDFNKMLHIDFLLIHEIAKYKKMKQLFEPITEHYDIYIPDKVLKESKEDLERYISCIIELRLNEIKTLVNMILLNIEDANEEMILTKEDILNFSYDDIFNRSKDISENTEVEPFMNVLEEPRSSQLSTLFFEKVDDYKDNLVKCLLDIFYHELLPTKEKTATFFIIDQWFKKMIKDGLRKQRSQRIKEICEHLICPLDDPPISQEEEEFVLYLNPISKYMGAISELKVIYFSSLLDDLSCSLFTEHFEAFYDEYSRYKLYIDNPAMFRGRYSEDSKEILQKALYPIINSGFLTVQEKEIIAQLTYIQ